MRTASCAHLEGVDQAGHFAAGILDRLAGLDAQGMGEFVEAFLEALDAMLKHGLALVGAEIAKRLLRSDGGVDGRVNGGRIGLGHACGHLAGVLVGDLEVGVGLNGLVRQVIGIGVTQHLCLLMARRIAWGRRAGLPAPPSETAPLTRSARRVNGRNETTKPRSTP